MLICRISDESEGADKGRGIEVETESSQEYHTANKLFELITKNRHFDDNDEDSLATQDMVLLYKNIDIGTRLMSDATEVRRRKPNQYVETVVYNDEPEYDSDISENLSTDDLHNIFKINQERLNLFDNGSFDNILCHKLGGLEIKTTGPSAEYNKQFLFKDPYIRQQLEGINVMASCSEFDNLLPTSLLDYICCKRLEDSYNFDMDNIIRYVRHTIEQLKRISNGDYLTDRVKEKWEEVNKNDSQIHRNAKVLATSNSIPLHVECKRRGNGTWDDTVCSEVDVRSLSKILKKKIIVEIPKLICGSYRLFSKHCEENLIIRCKRGKQTKHRKDTSRVDVVLHLQRFQTGHVNSNINSIMILQSTPAVPDLRIPKILPITFDNSIDETDSKENSISVIECLKDEHDVPEGDTEANIQEVVTEMFEDRGSLKDESNIETNHYPFSNTECGVPHDMTINNYSSRSTVALRDILLDKPDMFQTLHESDFNIITPDELRVTMLRLNKQSSLPEESGEDASFVVSSKKKSPMRVRIKSPYENRAYILDEKKRKRLLEIREKREKKKMALGESAKVSKHNRVPAKVAVAPQASSSVTKLSITNKSFYNSIYGQSSNSAISSKSNPRKGVKRDSLALEIPKDQTQEEYFESPNLTPEKNGKKYINRSYYLDDTETAMMFMQMKQGENKDVGNTCSESTSAVSNEFSAKLNLLSHLITTSDSDLNKYETDDDKQNQSLDDDVFNNSKDACCSSDIPPAEIIAPKCTPKAIGTELDDVCKKVPLTVECRKSIDKLYDLMKKLGKTSTTDFKKSSKLKTIEKTDAMTGGSTIQGSDSGASLKHKLTSSNHSFSFEKSQPKLRATRKKEQAANVVSKVIISSKLQSSKLESDRLNKDRKKFITSQTSKTVPENPLKAISQLLHDFDNIQKTKQKVIPPDFKSLKKVEIASGDGKTALSRQNSFRRRSRIDYHTREKDQEKKVQFLRDKRTRPLTTLEISRIPHQQIAEDKQTDKVAKQKISDVLDEAKEARGEAVRGPTKLNSRLNSLAQPRRSYVQAHSEEYQNKYGKNLMADRLQRLAMATTPQIPHTNALKKNRSSPTSRNRVKVTSSVSMKPPSSAQSIDKTWDTRRPNSSSPNRRPSLSPPMDHKHVVSDAPETITKVVAVESYVNSRCGNSSTLRSELPLSGNKSRVPLLSSDLEIPSMTSSPGTQEAGELGKKLHHIIHSMITDMNPLTALDEARETISEPSSDVTDDQSADQRTDSDYNIDILEDTKLDTAVESQSADKQEEMIDEIFEHSYTHNQENQPFSSTTELQKLENALHNQISGAFQKRLRIKKMTLSPKQSLQQMFLLKSGDAGPLFDKSTVSSLKSKYDTKSLQDLKSLSFLSNAHLNWNFTQIPMQIATVGYVFPLYQPDCGSKLDMKSISVTRTEVSNGRMSCKSDKISQCFKGVHQDLKLEQVAQVDVQEIVAGPIVNSGTEVIIAETPEELLDGVTVKPEDIERSKGAMNTAINLIEENTPAVEKIEISKTNDAVQTSQTPSPVSVDYTSSLDMLVGLLNEIQKITCQHKDPLGNELETMLNNAAVLERDSSRDIVSMTSLAGLKKLKSNPSIHTFYTSDPNFRCDNNLSDAAKPVLIDKEVNVNLCEKECVNISTNVSSVLPIAVNHSTNITKSLMGVISDPSSQSLVSFTDYSTLYSNTFFDRQSVKKIVGVPQVEYNEKRKEFKKNDLNEKCSESVTLPPTINIQRTQKSKKIVAPIIEKYSVNCKNNSEKYFEGAIKIKRDILVTVYSILVFTVFAALSFPGISIMEG